VRREEGGRFLRGLVAATPFVIAALSVTAFGSRHGAWGLILLLVGITFQACVVVMRRRHRMFGVEFAAGLLLVGLLAASFTGPRTGVLLILPAGFAYLFVGLALLQHEAVRERIRRALPHRRATPDESPTAVRRDVAALGLVVPACLLTLLLVPLATWTFPVRHSAAPGGDSAGAGRESAARPGERGRPPQPDARGISGLAPPPADTPDRSLQRPAYVEIRPWVQGMRAESIGALYLRGMPLVEAGSDRWREDFSGLRWIADADDGSADEWCAIRSRPATKNALMLEVMQRVPELASTGELVLLGPPAEAAFEVERLRGKPGGPYLVPRPTTNDPFSYRVDAPLPWRLAEPGTRLVARAPPRFPADREGAASLALADSARRAAMGVQGDVELVRAVMQTLRQDFRYERTEDRPSGSTSLADFVATRRGACIQFAKAGVVMLRHLGIASRVGTGFLVVDWDAERDAYVASARDRHAWVEVEIEGTGWVVFDPTPAALDAAPRAPEPMPPERPAAEGERGETGEDEPAGDGPESEPTPEERNARDDVRMVISDVRRALSEIGRAVGENWPLFAATALLMAGFAGRSLLARKRRLAGERPAGPVVRGPWESLVAELARRGHRRRASQTASEFARAVADSGGPPYAALLPLTARRESARFGGQDLTPADDAAIDAFRASLPPR
jgi:hypothetical protein